MELQEIKPDNKKKLILANLKIAGKFFIAFLLAGVLVVAGLYGYKKWQEKQDYSNRYMLFFNDVYGTIKDNYWDSITDQQLVNLYVLAAQKITGVNIDNPPKEKKILEKLVDGLISKMDSDQKKVEFSSNLEDMVLANLEPFGRSRLYSQKDTTDLQNRVENVTGTDQYQILGVPKTASLDEINKVYNDQTAKLQNDKSEQAQKKLADLTHAYNTLSDTANKTNYDTTQAEPTLEGRLLSPEIFYLKMSKFSPTMVSELENVTQKVDKGNSLDTLIFDLRDNVGGLIDGLPYILGPFIGNNQYAYQFFQKGKTEDFKTVMGWMPSLVRYKKVIFLINENSQSSAEQMAAVMKKYHVGLVVGTKTRGWGTVEKVFEVNHQIDSSQKFSVYLVHHLTLREDGQPIEGRGVEPDIDISKPDWATQLYNYYHYQPLVDAVKNLLK